MKITVNGQRFLGTAGIIWIIYAIFLVAMNLFPPVFPYETLAERSLFILAGTVSCVISTFVVADFRNPFKQ